MSELTQAELDALGAQIAIENWTLPDPIPPGPTWMLANNPLGDVTLSVNGQVQRKGIDYTLAGAVVTWTGVDFVLSPGDVVQIEYLT